MGLEAEGPAIFLQRVTPRLGLLLAGLAAIACADVDRDSYVAGDTGETTFANPSARTVYLAGCSIYSYEKLEPRGWIDRGPAVVCVWEGFAKPVESGEVIRSVFGVPDEVGTWRLVYPVGLACAEDEPLGSGHCERTWTSRTRSFDVIGLCEPVECGPLLGMPNWLCPDGENFGGPTDRCLRDLETGACGWEILSCPE